MDNKNKRALNTFTCILWSMIFILNMVMYRDNPSSLRLVTIILNIILVFSYFMKAIND